MSSGALRKPQLRGLLTRQIFRNLSVTFGIIVATVTTLRYTLVKRRKNDYLEYYRNLDSEAMFNDMRKAGVFQSVPPEDKDEIKADERIPPNNDDDTKKKGKKA